jgi:hypothetical protein
MRVKMEGYVHLARMIDKCRAVLAKTEGEYIYPCPMDERLMEFAGITADQFTSTVRADPSDDAVGKWFTQAAKAHTPAELETWNRMMLTRGPGTPASMVRFKKYLNAVDPARTDLTAWADLQDLEEGRNVPKRTPQTR